MKIIWGSFGDHLKIVEGNLEIMFGKIQGEGSRGDASWESRGFGVPPGPPIVRKSLHNLTFVVQLFGVIGYIKASMDLSCNKAWASGFRFI